MPFPVGNTVLYSLLGLSTFAPFQLINYSLAALPLPLSLSLSPFPPFLEYTFSLFAG